MALGNTNISVNAVCNEMGLTPSTTRTWTELTGHATVNKFSFYAPGSLDVDASKNVTLTGPASNMKFGDFRSYNHSAAAPSLSPPSQLNYGPGAGNISVQIGFLVNQMNIWSFATPADQTSYKLYSSSANRISESNPYQHTGGDSISITALTWSTTTPPTGHSRTSTKLPVSTQPSDSKNFNSTTNGFSQPNQTVYGDAFLGANITGARVINMGTNVADGYFSFVAHEQQQPYVTQSGNVTPPSGQGYTACFIEVMDASTPLCQLDEDVDMTWNSSTYSFYVHMRGIHGSDNRIVAVQDCDIYLDHDGGKQLIHSGSLSHSSNTLMSGTLSNSNTWSYDEVGYVTVENITWDTTPSYTTC